MSNLAEQQAGDFKPKIKSLIGTLSLITEYFEVNSIKLPHIKVGAMENSLKGVIQSLADIENELQHTAEFQQLVQDDIDSATSGQVSIQSISSNKLIDMFLDCLDSKAQYSVAVINERKIISLMKQNREERRNRLKPVENSGEDK